MSELPPPTEPSVWDSWEHYWTYSGLSGWAGSAARYLLEARKRPIRHNKRIERDALQGTVRLDEVVERVLMPGNEMLLMPPSTDATFRYELQAGVRTVHAVFPFTPPERLTLYQHRQYLGGEVEGFESPLIDRWREWLWMDERGEPQNNVENLGASALLLEACIRLNRLLAPTVQESPTSPPPVL